MAVVIPASLSVTTTPLHVAELHLGGVRLGALPRHQLRHQGSHLHLAPELPLDPKALDDTRYPGLVDLIVMPTSRSAGRAREAIQSALGLARRFGAAVLVLCSGAAKASDVIRLIPHDSVRLAVVDLPKSGLSPSLLPRFRTSDHMFAARDWTWPRDVATKRNLALLLAVARRRPWVLFLDDDVRTPGSSDRPDYLRFGDLAVANAFHHLRKCLFVVGWTMTDFPDNSAVCHARRMLGFSQSQFIGGGSLAVRATTAVPFFPRVYNEDWVFIYPFLRDSPDAVGGAGEIHQAKYNPFASGRARSEELMDILAEGLFNGLGKGCYVDAVWDADYWQQIIRRRTKMIQNVVTRLAAESNTAVALRIQMMAALEDALDQQRVAAERTGNRLGEKFRDFLVRWHGDRQVWRDRLERVRPEMVDCFIDEHAVFVGCNSTSDFLPNGDAADQRRG